MPGMGGLGKILIVLGGLLVVTGVILTYGGRFLPLGRLPGDIYVQRGSFHFYFPLATGLLVSLLLTLLLNVLKR